MVEHSPKILASEGKATATTSTPVSWALQTLDAWYDGQHCRSGGGCTLVLRPEWVNKALEWKERNKSRIKKEQKWLFWCHAKKCRRLRGSPHCNTVGRSWYSVTNTLHSDTLWTHYGRCRCWNYVQHVIRQVKVRIPEVECKRKRRAAS